MEKTLAIKGHSKRGKEVIEIFEMLGGTNRRQLHGDSTRFSYFKNNNKNITFSTYLPRNEFICFTLKDFLKKYPFKVGDKVIVKGLSEYPKNINFMKWFDGNIHYSFDNETWFLPSALKPYKEETKETMEERKYADLRLDVDQDDKLATEATVCGNKILPPNGYLIGKITDVDNGMLVEFVKKQSQYPKTYDECCDVLQTYCSMPSKAGYKEEQIAWFQELLICRDAYWKIAGEEMGLSKPWKPENPAKHYIFVIDNFGGVIRKNEVVSKTVNRILFFPTKEMRDAFFENFKDLIEKCKEFL